MTYTGKTKTYKDKPSQKAKTYKYKEKHTKVPTMRKWVEF